MIYAWPWLLAAAVAGEGMVPVGPGTYRPQYPTNEEDVEQSVERFLLDRLPVTNGQFLSFVNQHGSWRRDKVSPLFADPMYLARWESADELGEALRDDQPVVQVSWFAARAYCEERGARLPTEAEWELAGLASVDRRDASGDPERRAQILAWYGKPSTGPLADVGARPANAWGVHDLHGLTWEWVEDFSNNFVSSDPRDAGDEEILRFCGAGAVSATEAEDYASFMRVAFRSSLKATFTTGSLGFRCASNPEEE